MTRAAATAYAIGLAREHLGDYVPTADVTLTTSREPTTALGGGVRLVVVLTVVVDDPDAPHHLDELSDLLKKVTP